MTRNKSLVGLGAAVALMLGAHGSGLGGGMTGPAVRDDFDLPPGPNQRGRRRGPMPKPSKPMSEEYRANVQAQRGFSTRRLTQLRRDWRLECAVCKRAKKDEPVWAEYLNAHRRQAPLEQQFATPNT